MVAFIYAISAIPEMRCRYVGLTQKTTSNICSQRDERGMCTGFPGFITDTSIAAQDYNPNIVVLKPSNSC